jgi:hypothetical protein
MVLAVFDILVRQVVSEGQGLGDGCCYKSSRPGVLGGEDRMRCRAMVPIAVSLMIVWGPLNVGIVAGAI